MRCSYCLQPNVVWRGPWSNLTHTERLDCGRTNCQIVDEDDPDASPDNQTLPENG